MKRSLIVAALALLMAAPVTLASGQKAEKNPVVDLTGRINPGLWETTVDTQHAGKSSALKPDTNCITAADLKDFLNSADDNPTVKKYSLHGDHLYVEGVGKKSPMMKSPMTMVENIHFDDPDHIHGTIKMHGAYEIKGVEHKIDTTTKITSKRISSTCPKGSDD